MFRLKPQNKFTLCMILILSLFLNGCTTLLNGDLTIEYIEEKEAREKAAAETTIEKLDYDNTDAMTEAKYASEYPDAFYIPPKYSKNPDRISEFKVLDHLDNSTFVYLYQTRVYASVSTGQLKNTQITILATYNYIHKIYTELVSVENGTEITTLPFAQTLYIQEGNKCVTYGYGIFYDNMFAIYDAAEIKKIINDEIKKSSKSTEKTSVRTIQVKNAEIISYGGRNNKNEYTQESKNIKTVIESKLKEKNIDQKQYELNCENASFYIMKENNSILYEVVVTLAASKAIDASKEDEKAVTNSLESADSDYDNEEAEKEAQEAEKEADTHYFELVIHNSKIDNLSYKISNKNVNQQIKLFNASTSKMKRKKESQILTRDQVYEKSPVVFNDLQMNGFSYYLSTDTKLNNLYDRFRLRKINFLNKSNLDAFMKSLNYTDADIGKSITDNFQLSLLQGNYSAKSAIRGTLKIEDVNYRESTVYYTREEEYTVTTTVSGNVITETKKRTVSCHKTEQFLDYYTVSLNNVSFFRLEMKELRKINLGQNTEIQRQYLVGNLQVSFASDKMLFYDDGILSYYSTHDKLENNDFDWNQSYFQYRVLLTEDSIKKGLENIVKNDKRLNFSVSDNIQNISVRVFQGDAYIYMVQREEVTIYQYDDNNFSINSMGLKKVLDIDLKALNIKANVIFQTDPEQLTEGLREQIQASAGEAVSKNKTTISFNGQDFYDSLDGDTENWVSTAEIAAAIEIIPVYQKLSDTEYEKLDEITCFFTEQGIYFYNQDNHLLINPISYEDVISCLNSSEQNDVNKLLSGNEILRKAWYQKEKDFEDIIKAQEKFVDEKDNLKINENLSITGVPNLKEVITENLHWEYTITFPELDSKLVSISRNNINVGSFTYVPGQIPENKYKINTKTWDSIIKYLEERFPETEEKNESKKEYKVNENPVEQYSSQNLTFITGNLLGTGKNNYWVSTTPQNGVSIIKDSKNGQFIDSYENVYLPVFQKNELYESSVEKPDGTVSEQYIRQMKNLTNGVTAYGIYENYSTKNIGTVLNGIASNNLSFDYFVLGFDRQDAAYTNRDLARAKVIPFAVVDRTACKNYGLICPEGDTAIYLLQYFYDETGKDVKYVKTYQTDGPSVDPNGNFDVEF